MRQGQGEENAQDVPLDHMKDGTNVFSMIFYFSPTWHD